MGLLTRYEQAGTHADLEAVLAAARAAVTAGATHPSRSKFHSNLAVVLAAPRRRMSRITDALA